MARKKRQNQMVEDIVHRLFSNNENNPGIILQLVF